MPTQPDTRYPPGPDFSAMWGQGPLTEPLTLPSGARELWGWVAHTEEPNVAVRSEAVASNDRTLLVAVGSPGYGLAGFVRSHREALAAQRIAVQSRDSIPVTLYDTVQVPCLMTDDRETLRALVARELRRLAAPDPSSARLRETLRVYYSHNCKPIATAKALGLHKNTVRYRLDQVTELLGHDVDERRLPLELALISVDTYGDSLLDADAQG